MKRGTGTAALCISICLLLSGCGGRADSGGILGRASGLDEEQPLLTADGQKIPAWKVLYWLALTCERTETAYHAVGQEPDWAARVDGGTLSDCVKEQALSDAVLYAEVEKIAEQNGCTWDEADEAAVRARWEERCAAHGGEAAYLAVIGRYGLDKNRAMDLFRTGVRFGKLWEQCESGGSFSPVQPVQEGVRFDRILITQKSAYSARGRAEHLFSMLNASADQGTLFADLAAQSDDPAGPRTLGDGSIDDGLAEIVRNLEEGQLSGIVESGDGFSILRRLPSGEKQEPDLTVWMDETLEAACTGAAVERLGGWETLNAGVFFSALEQERGAESGG